jgi:hypothetical protein
VTFCTLVPATRTSRSTNMEALVELKVSFDLRLASENLRSGMVGLRISVQRTGLLNS